MKKGTYHSEKTKKIMSEKHKGEKNHMFGKHRFGKENPMHGKNHSEETKTKISNNKKGKKTGEKNPSWKGGKSERICLNCDKQFFIFPSQINYGYGKFCSRRCVGIWTMLHQKQYDTDIECLIEDELIKRNIPYSKQVPLLGISLVDFLLPKDIVIYADGSYWHLLKGRKIRDLNQDFMLTFYGYKVFRFTDKEIKRSVKKCIDRIIKIGKEN